MLNQNAHNKRMDNLKILPAVIARYIPEELRRHVVMKRQWVQSELEYIEGIFEGSNNKLRMYGSAENLLKNLLIYMDFPLRRKIFPIEMGHYKHVLPDAYCSLKEELFYCKQDYLFYLQSCVYSELRSVSDDRMSAELIEYMKKHEERLSGCYEFVKYDHRIFEKIRKLFFRVNNLQVYKPEKMITPFREAVVYQEKNYVEVFDGLISEYPWIFLPNNETKDKRAAAVVRVFDDRCEEYVMESELFNAINLKNQDRKPLECEDVDKGFLKTLDYKHVLETYGDEITDIDFISYPVLHSDHLAVPIPTPTGEHCVRASAALLEKFSLSVKSLKVFQKIKRNTWHMVPKFVAMLEKYFPPDIKYRYFITFPLIKKMHDELIEFWKPLKDKPAKEVRDVGPNGFTAEDLRKELKYLGYMEIFPEITTEARRLYEGYLGARKSQLTTHDMFRAIEICVVTVILNRFPSLREFLSRQKNCNHGGAEPCKLCRKAFKDAAERIEAEKMEEQAAKSSEVIATTDEVEEDNCSINPEALENSEESAHETAVSKAENITDSVTIAVKNEKPEENQEPNPVLPDSNAELCEVCMETFMILAKKLKEKDAELKRIESILNEKTQRCEELEKTIKEKDEKIHELSEAEQILNNRDQFLRVTTNNLAQQLRDKNKEIEAMKKAYAISEAAYVKGNKKLNDSFDKFQKEVNEQVEQLRKDHFKMEELEAKNSRISSEKNEENEKLKKQQASMAKENKKLMEQMKQNASKSIEEAKKLTAKIARLKQSINELLEKLQKSDFNLQDITKKYSLLETEITDKNRIILELQKSAEKQTAEQEKAKIELETLVSTLSGALDKISPLEPTEKHECLICFEEMKSNQYTLKCEHCRKVVHLECASKWLKIHRSCAHCRREQLDPTEFPNLR